MFFFAGCVLEIHFKTLTYQNRPGSQVLPGSSIFTLQGPPGLPTLNSAAQGHLLIIITIIIIIKGHD